MAVNRFMKPAEQPLLNTYVPLPFKEMSLAYATKQKAHTDAEVLAESLDDEILKIKASSPEHSEYLTQYREGLKSELSDLYDKNGGRYADMVPNLKIIKNRTELDILQGNLGVIKSSTKETDRLQKKITKAKEDEKYDTDFNPVMGSENDWQGFFHTGTDGRDESGAWNLTEESRGIYGTEGGRLKPFKYTGLHPHVDELKEANENIFKYVKPDVDKLIRELKSGATITQGNKEITLSKLYNAANANKQFLSGAFKDELDYVVNNQMKDEDIIGAANNAIDNMFGSDAYLANMYGAKPTKEQQEAIAKNQAQKKELQETLSENGAPTNRALELAKTNYIGAMGEKFLMTDVFDSLTWDQSVLDKKNNAGRTAKTDWVPVISGSTPVVSLARPYKVDDPSTSIQEGGQPLQDFNTLIVDRKKNYEDALNEYELLKAQGTMDDEMHESKQDNIRRVKYQYQAAAFSQKNLLQTTATDMQMKKGPGLTGRPQDAIITYVVDGKTKSVGVGSPAFINGGFSNIEFNDEGYPISMSDWDGQESLTTQHLGYDYSEGFLSFLDNPKGDLFNGLKNKVENAGQQGWYGGRSAKLPTWNTTLSKSLDGDVGTVMQSNFTKDDYKFTNNEGAQVSLTQLEENKIIKDEVIDEFIVDSDLPIVWTTVPDPATGNYKGMISIPTDGKDANNTTMTLYFDAPVELKESWMSLTEDYDAQGLKYTRATTPTEKVVFRNNFDAQMDIQAASTINGNVAPSMYHDGDNRVLGMYYFNRTPNGDPIVNNEFLFRPQAGLVASINPNGTYNYTTGDELFPTDIESSQLSQLIALNDPTKSSSLDFWKRHLSEELPTGNYPIAVQDSPVNETSEAREIDVTGMPYSTTLREGQTSYSGDRIQKNHLYGTTNQGLLGSNINFANQVILAEMNFGNKSHETIDNIANDFETTHKNVPVTLSDGTTSDIYSAMTNGDLTLQWATQAEHGQSSIPINNSNRSYQTQLDMYTKYVDGGKVDDPVADPNVGGFHVMGQAIDLGSDKSAYDLILVAGPNISSIGSSRISKHNANNTGKGTQIPLSGVRLSELKSDGKLLYPNFIKDRLTSVFDALGKTTDSKGEAYTAPIRQFDKEWWHWSAGEFTTETPAVYPSW